LAWTRLLQPLAGSERCQERPVPNFLRFRTLASRAAVTEDALQSDDIDMA
jgi:hypothetical protein